MLRTPKRAAALLGSLALMATIAIAAAHGDAIRNLPLTLGQGSAAAEKVIFDVGSGSTNPAIQSTSGGVLQLSNDQTNWVSVPSANDTMCVLAAAQSPTNKTFDATTTLTGARMASFTPDGTHTLTAPTTTTTLAGLAVAETFTAVQQFSTSSATQANFSGWEETDGASAFSGQVTLGGTGAYQGRIHFDQASTTQFLIDNSYDSAAGVTKFRFRTSGTPVTALTLTGAGNATVGGNVTISGTGGNTPHGCIFRGGSVSNTTCTIACNSGEIATGGGLTVTSGTLIVASEPATCTIPGTSSSCSSSGTNDVPNGWYGVANSTNTCTAKVICCSY